MVTLSDQGAPDEPRPLHETASAEGEAQISPDGRWVAYTSFESGAADVYVHAFPVGGAKVRISTDGGLRARWARSSRELFYWGNVAGSRLMSVEIPADAVPRPGPPRLLFPLLVGTTWDVTPDRDRFLIELVPRGVRIATVTNWFEELRRRAPAKQ